MRARFVRSGVLALVVASAALLPGGVAGAGPSGGALDRTIVHGVPEVPLTIDGVSVPAADITKYNGRPLYMTVVPDAASERGRLTAFTDEAEFETFVRKLGAPADLEAPRPEAKPQPTRAPDTARPGPATADGSVDYGGYTYIFSGDYYSYFWTQVPSG